MDLMNKNLLKDMSYVDGEWIDANDGSCSEILNPANSESLGFVPNCGSAETLIKHELGQPKTAMQGADAKTSMEWDNDATEMLMGVPPPLRKMVIENTEEFAAEKNEDKVSGELFKELAKSVGMDTDVMERFRSGG